MKDMFWGSLKEIINSNDKINELMRRRIDNKYSQREQKVIEFLTDLYDEFNNYKYTDYPSDFCMKIDIEEDDVYQLLNIIDNILIKARLYDISWCKFKNYNHSQLAYENYRKIIETININDDNIFHILLRMFYLTVSTGKNEDKINYIKTLIYKYLINNTNDDTYYIGYLIEMFLDEKIKEYDFLIEIVKLKIDYCQEKEYSITFNYYNLLERIYCLKHMTKIGQITSNSLIIDIRKKKVNFLIDDIKDIKERSLININIYKEIIKILKTIPNTDNERREIIQRMEQCQKDSLNHMKRFNYSMDISNEVTKLIKEISGKNIKELLAYYALNLGIINKSELMNKNKSNDSVFQGFMSKSIIDKNGKIKAYIPSPITNKTNEREAVIEHEFTKNIQIYVNLYILPILKYINENFEITEEIIRNIVNKNLFVPDNRREAYVKGIVAGFREDYITALSILIPQVENSIRLLAKNCGDTIYRMNEDGIEEVATLSSVLDLQKLNECIEGDLIFNLKCIFTSKNALNMRNEIAHGNYDDNEFYSSYCIYT